MRFGNLSSAGKGGSILEVDIRKSYDQTLDLVRLRELLRHRIRDAAMSAAARKVVARPS